MTKVFLSCLLVLISTSLSQSQTCPGSIPAGMECVDSGGMKTITAHGSTRTITNSSPLNKALMIPILTSSEWSTFSNTPPSGVTASSPTFRLTTIRCAPYNAPCYYIPDAFGQWSPMRCAQQSDIGQWGTLGGCQPYSSVMTISGQFAHILYSHAYNYSWECEYRCDYY